MKEPQSKGDKEGVLQQVIDRRNDEIESLREQLSNMQAVVASVEKERDDAQASYWKKTRELEDQLASMTKELAEHREECQPDYCDCIGFHTGECRK